MTEITAVHNGIKQRSIIKVLMVAIAAMMLALATVVPVGAETANTPVGTVTVTQQSCGDLGAKVLVSVTGGFANATYKATSPGGLSAPKTFVTNGSGQGGTSLTNVVSESGQMTGTARVNLTVGGQAGTITMQVNCPGGKGA